MPPPTKKRPRKPNKNKDIEALLQLKDRTNVQTSMFIWDLIALKKGLNGRGDADHRLPPSRIHQKLDASITSLISNLTGQYRDLAQNSLQIVKQQEQLADTLSKKKSEKNKNQTEPQAAPVSTPAGQSSMFGNLVPEQKSASENVEFVTEATNPFSRSWYRMKAPFTSSPGARLLEGILFRLLDLKNETEEMQDACVSTSANDVNRLVQSKENFNYHLAAVNKQYLQYAKETGQTPSGENLGNEYGAIQSKFDNYMAEFLIANSIAGISGSFKHRFKELATVFKSSQNDTDRNDILQKMDMVYKQLIAYIRSEFKLSVNKPWSTIKEVYSLGPVPIPKDMGMASDPVLTGNEDQLQTLAHNILSRLLKKKRMELPFSDANAGIRLKVFQVLTTTRKLIIDVMNKIEKGEPEMLGNYIQQLKSKNDEITRLVTTLAESVSKINVKEKKKK